MGDKTDVLTKEDVVYLFSGLDTSENIEVEASFSWDGRNLLVRIPKDLANFLKINQDNRFENKIKFIVSEKNGRIKEQRFEILKRLEPRKKTRKDGTRKK